MRECKRNKTDEVVHIFTERGESTVCERKGGEEGRRIKNRGMENRKEVRDNGRGCDKKLQAGDNADSE